MATIISGKNILFRDNSRIFFCYFPNRINSKVQLNNNNNDHHQHLSRQHSQQQQTTGQSNNRNNQLQSSSSSTTNNDNNLNIFNFRLRKTNSIYW